MSSSSFFDTVPPLRDTLVRVPQYRAGRRHHVRLPPIADPACTTPPVFVALGTWTHPRSLEFDLVATNGRPNWDYKLTRFVRKRPPSRAPSGK